MRESKHSQFNITIYGSATESIRRYRDLMYGDASRLFKNIHVTSADWYKPIEDESALVCITAIVANCIGRSRKAFITLNRDTWDNLTDEKQGPSIQCGASRQMLSLEPQAVTIEFLPETAKDNG